MKRLKQQQGITLIGFILMLTIALMVVLVAMKMIPIYIEYGSVVKAMKTVSAQPGASTKSVRTLRDLIQRNFFTNYVDRVQPSQIKFQKSNGYFMSVHYEVREHIVGNVDIVMVFDHKEQIMR